MEREFGVRKEYGDSSLRFPRHLADVRRVRTSPDADDLYLSGFGEGPLRIDSGGRR